MMKPRIINEISSKGCKVYTKPEDTEFGKEVRIATLKEVLDLARNYWSDKCDFIVKIKAKLEEVE